MQDCDDYSPESGQVHLGEHSVGGGERVSGRICHLRAGLVEGEIPRKATEEEQPRQEEERQKAGEQVVKVKGRGCL